VEAGARVVELAAGVEVVARDTGAVDGALLVLLPLLHAPSRQSADPIAIALRICTETRLRRGMT
jgi:hypothetical protein